MEIAIFLSVVIIIELAISSCSACESKSIAKSFESALLSAIIPISLGPAIMSIFTSPKTNFLAVATKILPGPVITSTFGIFCVP